MKFAPALALMACPWLVGCLFCGPTALAQAPPAAADLALATRYLAELRAAGTAEAGRTWGLPLYGPVLLVKPDTRELFASEADSAGRWRASGAAFVGTWPPTQPLANTAVTWQGKRWSLLLWPLPTDAAARQTLAFHEFFHRVQPALGFGNLGEADNQHLDQEAGRVWLKLELEALKAALRATAGAPAQVDGHLHRALLFRQYRRSRFAGAAANENRLELNEGLAEYTGLVVAARPPAAAVAHLVASIDTFYRNPTFVRSFAYCTVPAYGYLLRARQPAWHRAVRPDTDLTALFAAAFGYADAPAAALEAAAARAAAPYGAKAIRAAEAQREAERQRRIVAYRRKFAPASALRLPLLSMSISFDPRNMQPLGPEGTVYPHLKLSDKWGTLTADNGALLAAKWDQVTVPAPAHVADRQATGDGYTLQLNPGWVLEKTASGGYTLRQQP